MNNKKGFNDNVVGQVERRCECICNCFAVTTRDVVNYVNRTAVLEFTKPVFCDACYKAAEEGRTAHGVYPVIEMDLTISSFIGGRMSENRDLRMEAWEKARVSPHAWRYNEKGERMGGFLPVKNEKGEGNHLLYDVLGMDKKPKPNDGDIIDGSLYRKECDPPMPFIIDGGPSSAIVERFQCAQVESFTGHADGAISLNFDSGWSLKILKGSRCELVGPHRYKAVKPADAK